MNLVFLFIGTIRHKGGVILGFARGFWRIHRYRHIVRRDQPHAQFTIIALIEHLGDIVACEPVSRYVKSASPGTKTIWLVKHEYRELLENNPFVDLVVTVHCLSVKDILIRWCKVDRVLDMHFFERYCSLCNATGKPKPSKKQNTSGITLQNFYEKGDILKSMSLFAGLPALEEQPRIHISEDVELRVNALHLPSQFIVIHCSSNTDTKDWQQENWEKIVYHIEMKYRNPVVEVGLHAMLAGSSNGLYRNLSGQLSILETGEVIRRAKLFIGIDSGPAHLANAVGTYGIVLLGSYLGFDKYNPFSGAYGNGKNASLIHVTGPVANLPVRTVIEEVDAILKTESR